MNDTLALFDELLEHDSGSKIFFPLARLYRKQGHTRRAIEVVQKGIERHPDYLEAQLYLIDLLCEEGEEGAAEARAQTILDKLLTYEKFWSRLREHYARSQQPDLALAAFVLERNAMGGSVDLAKVMTCGLAHYAEAQACGTAPVEPEKDLDAEEVAQFCINSGIKTKTMARLLSAQGEHEQAIRIYDDLLETAASDEERGELKALRDQAYAALGSAPDPGDEKNDKLYFVLNSLADRLERKFGADSPEAG